MSRRPLSKNFKKLEGIIDMPDEENIDDRDKSFQSSGPEVDKRDSSNSYAPNNSILSISSKSSTFEKSHSSRPLKISKSTTSSQLPPRPMLNLKEKLITESNVSSLISPINSIISRDDKSVNSDSHASSTTSKTSKTSRSIIYDPKTINAHGLDKSLSRTDRLILKQKKIEGLESRRPQMITYSHPPKANPAKEESKKNTKPTGEVTNGGIPARGPFPLAFPANYQQAPRYPANYQQAPPYPANYQQAPPYFPSHLPQQPQHFFAPPPGQYMNMNMPFNPLPGYIPMPMPVPPPVHYHNHHNYNTYPRHNVHMQMHMQPPPAHYPRGEYHPSHGMVCAPGGGAGGGTRSMASMDNNRNFNSSRSYNNDDKERSHVNYQDSYGNLYNQDNGSSRRDYNNGLEGGNNVKNGRHIAGNVSSNGGGYDAGGGGRSYSNQSNYHIYQNGRPLDNQAKYHNYQNETSLHPPPVYWSDQRMEVTSENEESGGGDEELMGDNGDDDAECNNEAEEGSQPLYRDIYASASSEEFITENIMPCHSPINLNISTSNNSHVPAKTPSKSLSSSSHPKIEAENSIGMSYLSQARGVASNDNSTGNISIGSDNGNVVLVSTTLKAHAKTRPSIMPVNGSMSENDKFDENLHAMTNQFELNDIYMSDNQRGNRLSQLSISSDSHQLQRREGKQMSFVEFQGNPMMSQRRDVH